RPYLHFAGVNRIDGLLLTHGDSLHIGGAEPLLQDFSPAVLIDNPSADRSTIHRRLRDIFAFRRLNATTHEKFPISSDVAAQILFPPPEFRANTADDQAFVVQLSMKTAKVLLMSDGGYETEKWLLGSRADLRSDVLIKGQHHSGSSGSSAFLDAVWPQ